ncbi:MAG: hypothetical protein KDC87_03305 [Planctomycetes bacterium]|nr:hypothetical protein [Planctomycetota bacterium]MCB9872105.1 hypothetical protein [Planctomycetota bacterium]
MRLSLVDDLLRARRPDQLVAAQRGVDLALLLCCAGFVYGAALGGSELRPLQMLYSGVKVPILLVGSALVCLPNFYVVNTVLGLREDLPTVLRGLVGMQVMITIALASFAPCTVFFYTSVHDYTAATMWNGVMFFAASIVGHVYLGRVYQPLIAHNPRHRIAKRAWLTLYVFVAIQLAWMLRPFIGAPGMPTTFFRAGVWDNAYMIVLGVIGKFLGL